jgi:type II secretory pathway pseudopilin PulG
MKHHRINSQISTANQRATQLRRGFLLIELIVAMILLGTVAAVLPVTLNAVYKQRQQERFERLAQLELSNIITRLRIDEADHQLSDWFQEMYPDASIEISSGQQAADTTPAPTLVSIRREESDSQPPLQQTLTTWIERPESAE